VEAALLAAAMFPHPLVSNRTARKVRAVCRIGLRGQTTSKPTGAIPESVAISRSASHRHLRNSSYWACHSMNINWLNASEAAVSFERDYVTRVLNQFDNTIITNFNGMKVARDTVIVYASDAKFVDKKIENAIKYSDKPIIYHLRNERLIHRCDYYQYARIILRQYYDPNCRFENVIFTPLGFQSGFPSKAQATTGNRGRPYKYVWAFIGQLKSDRAKMVKRLDSLKPNFQYHTSGWMTRDILSVEEVCSIYSQTIFVPCPMGNINPDSFRIMEALENNCIPVVVKFYGYDIFKYTFGDHPFITGSSWRDCAQKISRLIEHESELIRKQAEVKAWYQGFSNQLSQDVERVIVSGSSKNCLGSQFMYQAQGRKDAVLKLIFAWHFNYKPKFVYYVRRIAEKLGLIKS